MDDVTSYRCWSIIINLNLRHPSLRIYVVLSGHYNACMIIIFIQWMRGDDILTITCLVPCLVMATVQPSTAITVAVPLGNLNGCVFCEQLDVNDVVTEICLA